MRQEIVTMPGFPQNLGPPTLGACREFDVMPLKLRRRALLWAGG
jgi:hypothetical protein